MNIFAKENFKELLFLDTLNNGSYNRNFEIYRERYGELTNAIPEVWDSYSYIRKYFHDPKKIDKAWKKTKKFIEDLILFSNYEKYTHALGRKKKIKNIITHS